MIRGPTRASEIPDLWYQARKKVGDIKQTLPEGVQGPFFAAGERVEHQTILARSRTWLGSR
jgi:hypothetical protein